MVRVSLVDNLLDDVGGGGLLGRHLLPALLLCLFDEPGSR